jgi:pyridinium-3,5-biscarboxylic acid mononucleotide sulfurtransferase
MVLLAKKISVRDNFDSLLRWFRAYESCIVAFSGGVDSSILALAAKKALGDRALAVTSLSPAFAHTECEEARKIAGEIGIELFEVTQDDLRDPNYVKNEVSRCYFCRTNLVRAINPIRTSHSVEVCVDGTHLDDLQKPRPGVKALRENGFRAPFVELGFGKQVIRDMARISGLSNWNRPSEACLSSRVAFGVGITKEMLERVERAEDIVKLLTGAQVVRVRTLGRNAVVEVNNESLTVAFQIRDSIRTKLREIGYDEVEIDQHGYSSGRMLELFINSTER